MNPVPLNDIYPEVLRAAKSAVISKDKHVITALLKNGDAVRILSMGCQHSAITVRLWTQSYSVPGEGELKGSFSRLAKLSLPENEAQEYIRWLTTAVPQNARNSSRVVFTGLDTSRLVSFEAEFQPDDFGSTLDITYEYQ